MKSPLHILHLEDDPNDTALVQSTLAAAAIACVTTRLQSRDAFLAALEHGGVDLVLSDYSLPAFDGLDALALVCARWPDVPVIMVSGTMGEERAIESLNSGATDYVLKENLARLAPAVRRAMREAEDRVERRRLETQFIEAQKMEVVGHLAAGVAHDFNNIIAVISGYSHLMLDEVDPNGPMRKYLGEIQHATERAVGLTRQLLIFSRKQNVQPAVLNLDAVLKEMEKMLRRLLDENIALKIVSGKHTGRIKADSGYVGQVLMNLVINARDAMPNGGKLTVATSNVTLDENYAGNHPSARAGDYVMLSVTDTGAGMTEAVKAHLFEPFFTTKPKGKGTGLGLATCQTIVQQSGGHIGVYSEFGKGTTFKVYFPRVAQPLDAAASANQAGPLPRGTETLLVVEDEPSVRHLACRVLEKLGYHVLRANNGHEGLRVAREFKGPPIQLVITDVIMPEMGGKVMAEWLKTSYPDLKILFTSGYTDDAIAQHGVLDLGAAFVPKPYTPTALARKVRAMLDNQTDTTFLRQPDLPTAQRPPGAQ